MRPDVPNEISWGDLDERIDFPKCNVFQVHHPKYFIFWDRRISVILQLHREGRGAASYFSSNYLYSVFSIHVERMFAKFLEITRKILKFSEIAGEKRPVGRPL